MIKIVYTPARLCDERKIQQAMERRRLDRN